MENVSPEYQMAYAGTWEFTTVSLVKNLPAMQETLQEPQLRFRCQDPLEKEVATLSNILA